MKRLVNYIVPAILAAAILSVAYLFVFASNGHYVAHFFTGSFLLPIISGRTVYVPKAWSGKKLRRYLSVIWKLN